MIRLFLLLILFSTNSFAHEDNLSIYKKIANQEIEYAENSHSKIGIGFHSNKEERNILFIRIVLEDGWKTFWKNPGDSGSPLKIDWKNSENVKDINILWTAPKRFVEKIDDDLTLEVWGYAHEVFLPIEVIPNDLDKEGRLNVDINYTICNKICLPQSATLSVFLPDSFRHSSKYTLEDIRNLAPAENGKYGMEIRNVFLEENQLIIEAFSQNGFENPDIFVTGDVGGVRFPMPKIEIVPKNNTGAFFKINYEKNIPNVILEGKEVEITLVDKGLSVVKKTVLLTNEPVHEKVSKWVILILPVLFGFMGGVLLNIMPCVLPVISLKFLSLVEYGGKDKKQVRMAFVASALGIICSFLFLAIMTIGLKFAGLSFGWGIHFQQPVFIVILALIVALFATSLYGIYEIPLPSWIGSFALKYGSKGLWGHFMTGIFTTVLATPCSAPFLGTAVGFALSHGCFEIILIFLSMGLGLAFPFIVIALHPQFVSRLPKPGFWMVRVKQFLGLLLALTALWLIWVLSQQVGNIIAVVMLCLFVLLVIILRFVKSFKVKFVLILGLFIVGISMPFFVERPNLEQKEQELGFWKPFNKEDISKYVEDGKVVFIKITADWCITCKANKYLVLNSKKVIELLSRDDVIAMRGDWTNPSVEITEYLQEKDRFGIPFNIVYSRKYPNGVVLSELLTEREILEVMGKALKETE